METIYDFAKWIADLPHKHKIFVPGNHDFCFDITHNKFNQTARLVLEERGMHFLLDTRCEIEGLVWYGSPWVPNLKGWAFYDRGRDYFVNAPRDIEVLVTHDPPEGVRDGALTQNLSVEMLHLVLQRHARAEWTADQTIKLIRAGLKEEHVGSSALARYVKRCPRLELHIFGHVHEGYGVTRPRAGEMGHIVANAASLTRAYKPLNPPVVIDLSDSTC